jgi:hypothetical protein
LGGGKIIRMDVLKIATAGSVDDGKVMEGYYTIHQIAQKKSSKAKGYDYLDFFLLQMD